MQLLAEYSYFCHLKWKIRDKFLSQLFEKSWIDDEGQKGNNNNSQHFLTTNPVTDIML